jgi:Laminin G domain
MGCPDKYKRALLIKQETIHSLSFSILKYLNQIKLGKVMRKLKDFNRSFLSFALISVIYLFAASGVHAASTVGVNDLSISSFSSKFDGSSYSSLGPSAGNFGTNNFTIKLLIQTDSSSWQGVLGKRSNCGHENFWDIRTTNTGKLYFELDENGSSVYDPNKYQVLQSNEEINDGKLHKVVISRKRFHNGIKVSIKIENNKPTKSTKTYAINIDNDNELTVGRSACSGQGDTTAFIGSISDIDISTQNTNGHRDDD